MTDRDEHRSRDVAPGDRLLEYLSVELGRSNLRYSLAPRELAGGFDTSTFEFRLSGPAEADTGTLVLKLYPRSQGTEKARFEAAAQNALADAGALAPRVHLVCADTAVLGGAFIVMDRLPGLRLIDAPEPASSRLLGRAHADLHTLASEPVERALARAGFDRTSLHYLLGWFDSYVPVHPQISAAVEWLNSNRPPEPTSLSICHGDFHKLNVLSEGDQVTGVVDWSALTISDPTFDIATTIMIFDIPARHLVADATFPRTDLDQVIADYLEAYEANRPISHDVLDYYLAVRCLRALTLGLSGQKLWHHPGVAEDLARTVERVTGHSPAQ